MTAIVQAWRMFSSASPLALTGLGFIVLTAGGYAILLSPVRARAAALESHLSELERQLHAARARVGALVHDRRERIKLETQLESMVDRLFPTRDAAPLYRVLQAAAAEAGLGLTLFRPREPKSEGHFVAIPIVVVTEGTYEHLWRFLARIATVGPLLTIEELKITALARPQTTLQAELTLIAYVYRPIGTSRPDGGSAAAVNPVQRGEGLKAP